MESVFARSRLLGRIGVPVELVADRGADEIGAVRVEPLLNQVDMAEIDVTEV